MRTLVDDPDAVEPSDEDVELAKVTSQAFAHLFLNMTNGASVPVRLPSAENGREEVVAIPAVAFRLLTEILQQMALGNAVAVVPIHAELSTQQAADILNVSRPFLIKLIAEKKIACRMIGTHRRVLFKDLVTYKTNLDRDRTAALDELATQAQQLGLGY